MSNQDLNSSAEFGVVPGFDPRLIKYGGESLGEAKSIGDIISQQLDEGTPEPEESKHNWFRRHKIGVAVGTLAIGSIAFAAPEVAETATILKQNAPWVVPSLVVTETLWNSGAAMMLASAGKKIGNPLKLHNRIGELISSVSDSRLFRTGLGTNVIGELGTASIISAGSIAELPPSTWPLTIGSSALFMVPGVSLWIGVHRANNKNQGQDQQ